MQNEAQVKICVKLTDMAVVRSIHVFCKIEQWALGMRLWKLEGGKLEHIAKKLCLFDIFNSTYSDANITTMQKKC